MLSIVLSKELILGVLFAGKANSVKDLTHWLIRGKRSVREWDVKEEKTGYNMQLARIHLSYPVFFLFKKGEKKMVLVA